MAEAYLSEKNNYEPLSKDKYTQEEKKHFSFLLSWIQ